jgi:signal transduction histidine kinase
MEDKYELSCHGNPPGDSERAIAQGVSCSSSHPITESPDRQITGPPVHPICSPDHPITRLPDSNDCHECLAAMTHRLAQPLTALRGGIELGLMGKRSAAEYRALLEQSLQLADHMVLLIVSLRDLGESGLPGGPDQCVVLEETAKEVQAEMEGLAESRELHLQLTVEESAKVSANPLRLREALQSLLAWVIQNSAGGGAIEMRLSASAGEAHMFLAPSRLDLQYLQIKILEDITNPGLLFSHAAKRGALGWAINQRLVERLGGKLEMLPEGPKAGGICVRFPLATAS